MSKWPVVLVPVVLSVLLLTAALPLAASTVRQGIPAVVGCGSATTPLRSGDRVRVDGGQGVVEILCEA
jgi:hypothetical protein